jgi:hypothetical protein
MALAKEARGSALSEKHDPNECQRVLEKYPLMAGQCKSYVRVDQQHSNKLRRISILKTLRASVTTGRLEQQRRDYPQFLTERHALQNGLDGEARGLFNSPLGSPSGSARTALM